MEFVGYGVRRRIDVTLLAGDELGNEQMRGAADPLLLERNDLFEPGAVPLPALNRRRVQAGAAIEAWPQLVVADTAMIAEQAMEGARFARVFMQSSRWTLGLDDARGTLS